MDPQKRKRPMILWCVIPFAIFLCCSDSFSQVRLFSYVAEFDLAASYVRKDQWYACSGRSSHIWLRAAVLISLSPRMEQTCLIPNYEGIETLLAK